MLNKNWEREFHRLKSGSSEAKRKLKIFVNFNRKYSCIFIEASKTCNLLSLKGMKVFSGEKKRKI